VSRPLDSWHVGEHYEPYIGRWSRLVAHEFLDRLSVPSGARWLDIGSGTGALTEAVLGGRAPSRVVGMDRSPGFAAYAAGHVADPRATFTVGSAEALPFADASFDVVASALVLNFVPDRERTVREMRRVGRSGATVAAYVWDYTGGMQMLRRFWAAAAELDPATSVLGEGLRFDFCRPAPLTDLFIGAGLAEVAVEPIDVPTVFRDFDDYWSPFLLGQGPAPSYVTGLSETARAALRERLRDRLPPGDDGAIRLTARAWMVRGRTP
jgi:SAM-dependent methyltransferase